MISSGPRPLVNARNDGQISTTVCSHPLGAKPLVSMMVEKAAQVDVQSSSLQARSLRHIRPGTYRSFNRRNVPFFLGASLRKPLMLLERASMADVLVSSVTAKVYAGCSMFMSFVA